MSVPQNNVRDRLLRTAFTEAKRRCAYEAKRNESNIEAMG